MQFEDITMGQSVTCDGDPGVIIWLNADTKDTKVRFSDGDAYVHPTDLEPND